MRTSDAAREQHEVLVRLNAPGHLQFAFLHLFSDSDNQTLNGPVLPHVLEKSSPVFERSQGAVIGHENSLHWVKFLDILNVLDPFCVLSVPCPPVHVSVGQRFRPPRHS